jgi:DNA-binding response OmpR family regulator
VVLMDVRMPDLDGIAATSELLASVPDAKVVILTTFEDDEYILGALRAGASGFLLKRTSPEELTAAIHTVAAEGGISDERSTCLCRGLICSECGRRRMRRPISDYYDPEDGRWWHVPYFAAITRKCPHCNRLED